MRQRIAVLVAALAISGAGQLAAQRNSVGLSYDWSMPMGDLKNYADNDSWLGWTLDFRSATAPNLTVGGLIGYYEFYQNQPNGNTITFPQGALSGQQYRHLFSIPIMLSAQYYLGDGLSRARPYVGLGGGVSYEKQTVDIGIYSFESDAWVVSALPEIGVMFTTSRRTQFNLHARYFYPFGSDNLFSEAESGASLQHLSIGIGFMGRLF